MIRVLAIGNSFSEDAKEYVHEIAESAGIDLVIGNLYIGGCPLELHDRNAQEDKQAYVYEKTGAQRRMASIREALEEENWDFVTLQQVSQFSGLWETYQPYLTRLSEYVKQYAPRTEQLIHETWAYEQDSTHGGFAHYDCSQEKMYLSLRNAYDRAACAIGGARVIPSGDAMQIARAHPLFDYANGGKSLNRDGFHASWTHGRYLVGLTWVETLTGADLSASAFIPTRGKSPDEIPTEEEIRALKSAAHKAVEARKSIRI